MGHHVPQRGTGTLGHSMRAYDRAKGDPGTPSEPGTPIVEALPLAASPIVVVVLIGLLGLVVVGYAELALAGAIVLPIAGAIVNRPQRGVLLLVLLVPFDGVLAILPISSDFEAWKEALVVLTLLATLVCPAGARAPKGRPLPGWTPALASFVAIALVATALRHDLQGLLGLKTACFYVLLPVVVWRCPLGERDRDRLVSILMGTGFVCAIVGLAQQVVGADFLNGLGYTYNDTIRFAGSFLRSFSTFDQPFPFALFLMVVLLVGIPVAMSASRRARNRAFLLATPIYVAGMLSAFVRSAILGLAIGLLYLGLRRYRALLLWFPLALLAIVLVGSLGGAVAGPIGSSESLRQRSTGWEENVVQITEHPLGAGIGETGAAAATASESTVVDDLYQPDNYYFKTTYELGVVGLWMLVLVIVAAFVATHRAGSRIRGPDRALFDGIAAQILGAASAALVSSYFDIFPVDALFWLLVGIAASTAATAELGPSDPSSAPVDVDA